MTLVNQLYITSRSLSVTQVGHSEAKDPDECAHKRIAITPTTRLEGGRACTAVPLIVPLLLTLPKLSCARVCLKGSCSQTYASRVMPPGRRGSLGSLVGLATSAGPLAHHNSIYVPAMCQDVLRMHLSSLRLTMKFSGRKVTHHFHQKGTFELACEVRICRRGHQKMILVLSRVHIFIYVLWSSGLYCGTAPKFCHSSATHPLALADKMFWYSA